MKTNVISLVCMLGLRLANRLSWSDQHHSVTPTLAQTSVYFCVDADGVLSDMLLFLSKCQQVEEVASVAHNMDLSTWVRGCEDSGL